MVDATAPAPSELRGLSLDPAAVAEVQSRVEYLLTHPQELIVRRQDLERRTSRTMTEKERLEYRLLSAAREVKPITPETQQIKEVFEERQNDPRQPYIGMLLKYVSRRGEERSGRVWHPALVMKVRQHNILELSVIFDPQEIREVIAPKCDANTPRGGWQFIDGDAFDRVIAAEARIADLEAKLEALMKNGRSK